MRRGRPLLRELDKELLAVAKPPSLRLLQANLDLAADLVQRSIASVFTLFEEPQPLAHDIARRVEPAGCHALTDECLELWRYGNGQSG